MAAIEGLPELARNARKLKASFARTTLRTALRNAARPVVKEAKANAPTRTRQLRRDIKSKAKVTRSGFGYADVGFAKRSFYGGFVETGTDTQRAQPFLEPALDKLTDDGTIEDAFIGAINKTIANALGRL